MFGLIKKIVFLPQTIMSIWN